MTERKVPVLATRDLNVWLGQKRTHAVRGVDFSLESGEIVGLVGESGAGKSCFASSLIGLAGRGGDFEATGEVLFDGQAISAEDQESLARHRGKVTIVNQESMAALTPVRRIEDLLTETIRTNGSALGPEQGIDLLRAVGFDDPERISRSFAHELSGGMRQRTVFALALAADPKVLIADEPTTSIDLILQLEIMKLLADLRAGMGLSLLLISHDLGVVAQLADRVMVMKDGEIVESGPTEAVFASPKDQYTNRLMAADRARRGEFSIA